MFKIRLYLFSLTSKCSFHFIGLKMFFARSYTADLGIISLLLISVLRITQTTHYQIKFK